ncbi:response regulator transcription factor [Bacillus ndiopicus]|uniref:response regulator transcription factor n=1 Tax=Bacillus ndiopicus TaxID=1347368 RepID=UPI0005A6CB83|nr:response regulator transcription factor [Bacillus ndiopicus]
MHTVLLIDDEERMLNLVELFLSPYNIACLKETSGEKALEILKKKEIALVLLDVMMPYMDGWQVCQKIREFSNVPIIMLTARADKSDLVKGLNLGADDYIAKPFDEGELIARVNAQLRRASVNDRSKKAAIYFEKFILDAEMYALHYEHLTTSLTYKEFYILKALISRPSKTFTREELLTAAWEYEAEIDIRTVDSHIRNLRDKLKKASFPTDIFLKTVWGIGYKWN